MAQALRAGLRNGGLRRGGFRPGLGNGSLFAIAPLDMFFARTRTLDSRVTFTRASSGTYVGSDGLLKTATTNEPRFDHNPTTGESLGLLVEEQRTNLALRSEEFDTNWSLNGSTVSTNSTTSPANTLTADKLVENALAGEHNFTQGVTVLASTTYTLSCYAKKGERSFLALSPTQVGVANYYTWFDLNAGTIGTNTSGNTATITAVGNGWYRCTISRATAVGQTTINAKIGTASGDFVSGYTGDGSSGIFVWGAQLEAGSFPTSYIPTTTATATRSADVASITGTNFSSWYRQDEGTVFADVSVFSASKINQTISFNDGTGNNRWEARPTGTADVLRATCTVGNVLQFDTNLALTGLRRILAMSIKPGDSRIQSGASGVTLASFAAMPVVDRLYLNYATFAGGEINGTIRRLTYWPARLANSTLQTLTQ